MALFGGGKSSPDWAAFANGVHIRYLDCNDTYLSLEPAHPSESEAGAPPWLVTVDSSAGPVTAVAPPGSLGGRPLSWSPPLTGYGEGPVAWPTSAGARN